MQPLCQNRDMVLATKFCLCAGPPGYYCKPCFKTHKKQHHDLFIGEAAFSQETLCSECNRTLTKMFCICEDTLPAVCSNCETNHKLKDGLHWLFPISIKVRLGTEKAIEFVRNKVLYFMSARGKLQHNLAKVRKCKELILRNFDRLNGDANSLLVGEKNREIAKLEATAEALRREIAWGLQEVREHLLDEDFATESGISKVIFKFDCLEDMDSLDFFTFKSTDAGVESDNKLGVEWECRLMEDRKVSSCWMKAGAKLLPYVHANNVCLLTPTTMQSQTVKLKANIAETGYATWTFLPNGNIMIFGF